MFNKENSCLNCKYFVQYYVKDKVKFVRIMRGACRNSSLSYFEQRKHLDKLDICENFDKNDNVEFDKDSLEKVLRNMAQNLEDIALFIKNEY